MKEAVLLGVWVFITYAIYVWFVGEGESEEVEIEEERGDEER